jgi:hypothetical protein
VKNGALNQKRQKARFARLWTQSEGAPAWAHRNSPQRKHPTRQLGVWWSFFGGTETETNSKTDPAWSTFLKYGEISLKEDPKNKNKKILR